MTKRLSTTGILLGLLALSVLGVMCLSFWYVRVLSKAQSLEVQAREFQSQMAAVERNRSIMRAIAGEAIEYGKHNPAIDPILEKYDLKPKPGVPAPGKPSAH